MIGSLKYILYLTSHWIRISDLMCAKFYFTFNNPARCSPFTSILTTSHQHLYFLTSILLNQTLNFQIVKALRKQHTSWEQKSAVEVECHNRNWPKMVPKWPQNDPKIAQNDLNGFKVTSETISIEILPLLRLFWVVTWLVCDKFKFGDKNGPKMVKNGLKLSKTAKND